MINAIFIFDVNRVLIWILDQMRLNTNSKSIISRCSTSLPYQRSTTTRCGANYIFVDVTSVIIMYMIGTL